MHTLNPFAQPLDIDHLSDEELSELRKTASRLQPNVDVIKLSSGTGTEDLTNPSEANTLNLVFASTTIPIPPVCHGPMLAQLWPMLSTRRKLLVAFTLRRYVRQLCHCLKVPAWVPPGLLCADGSSPVFGQVQSDCGPFASYADLSTFFNAQHRSSMHSTNMPQDDPVWADLFDNPELLILTHQDINLQNIIVDKEGCLWLIDWAWVGYYLVWFEYLATRAQSKDPVISGTNDKLWKSMVPFICGLYFKQERWLERMGLMLYYL
ncbi:hypothetical protein C8Q78DRAFT_1072999 [Trametes maxima]|nr:hypothetical protein C8Q78DRAFT_1072999 [Trametes maxima]